MKSLASFLVAVSGLGCPSFRSQSTCLGEAKPILDLLNAVPSRAFACPLQVTDLGLIPNFLPKSPPLFPQDVRTDKSDEFLISETIREKLTQLLHKELPYGLTVQIEYLLKEKNKLNIDAVIWVERESQKKIAIGKDGIVLKKVGRTSRLELSDRFKKPVHLKLWVKVKSNWADNENDLNSLGYEVS